MGRIRIVAVSGPADREAHAIIWQGDEDAVPDFVTVPCGPLRGVREIRTIREQPLDEKSVLWWGSSWRAHYTGDGDPAYWFYSPDGSHWIPASEGDLTEVHHELGRRLLEERKQQEALDEHNDKLETAAYLAQEAKDEAEASERAAWSVLNKHQDRLDAFEGTVHPDLDRRLTVLEEKLATVQGLVNLDEKTLNIHLGKIEKMEQDLLLVREQAAHVDEREAADFEATRIHLDGLDEGVAALKRTAWKSESAQIQINSDTRKAMEVLHTRILRLENRPLEAMEPRTAVDPASPSGDQTRVNIDYSEWKRLVTLDELWGPEGTLRMKLAGTAVHTCPLHGLYLDWFRQLRSELLALPDGVKR